MTPIAYIGAAVAEIAGCFAFWAWLRLDKSPLWTLPGVASLILFAVLLTRVDSAFAGRAYAAYGGVYIAASLMWLWIVEGHLPDRWDIVGALVCLLGAALIIWGPRPARAFDITHQSCPALLYDDAPALMEKTLLSKNLRRG